MPTEPLFTRLAPILNVSDLAAERAFYEKLGLPVVYEGEEYPVSSPGRIMCRCGGRTLPSPATRPRNQYGTGNACGFRDGSVANSGRRVAAGRTMNA